MTLKPIGIPHVGDRLTQTEPNKTYESFISFIKIQRETIGLLNHVVDEQKKLAALGIENHEKDLAILKDLKDRLETQERISNTHKRSIEMLTETIQAHERTIAAIETCLRNRESVRRLTATQPDERAKDSSEEQQPAGDSEAGSPAEIPCVDDAPAQERSERCSG